MCSLSRLQFPLLAVSEALSEESSHELARTQSQGVAGYPFFVGGLLMAVPNVFMSLFWLPAVNPDTWLRVLGLVVVVLAYYYLQAARHRLRPMMEASVHGRMAASVVFLALLLLGLGPVQLLLFGLVDLVCALWTRQGLKAVEN